VPEFEVAPGLSLDSPVELAAADAEAIDSRAAAWEGPGLHVVVDEGELADPLLSYGARPDAAVREETIGGRRARVVTFTLEGGVPFAAAHFPADDRRGPLTISATGTAGESTDVPLHLLRSVTFS